MMASVSKTWSKDFLMNCSSADSDCGRKMAMMLMTAANAPRAEASFRPMF